MSLALVPKQFCFRFEVPIRKAPAKWKVDGNFTKWELKYCLPPLARFDESGHEFADVWMAWNESGLFIACCVEEKEQPLKCRVSSFWKGDNLRLCTDMRDTRDIKRATRFCQQFFFLPTGGEKGRAVAGSAKIHRAREDAPPVTPDRVPIVAEVDRSSYMLEAHLPADALSGFDPAEHRRIGLYYIVEDQDFGQQCLTIGDALNWHVDPSTWATGVLVE